MATRAEEALQEAQRLVSQAIVALASVGPEAPSTVRESLSQLGSAFSALGWADPAVPYSLPREGESSP
jgi:hypothetical protein